MSSLVFIEEHFAPCNIYARSTELFVPIVQSIEQHPDAVQFPVRMERDNEVIGIMQITHSLVSYDPYMSPSGDCFIEAGARYRSLDDCVMIWLDSDQPPLPGSAFGHFVLVAPYEKEMPIAPHLLDNWTRDEQERDYVSLIAYLDKTYRQLLHRQQQVGNG